MRDVTIALGLALLLVPCGESQATDWPGYRGPNRDGVSTESIFNGLESVGLTVAWRQKIGSGSSGIAIADGRIVTMFSDGTSDVIAAFDEKDGTELWRQSIEATYRGHDGSFDGPMTTPLIHDGRVFGITALGRLLAFELADGTPAWSIDLAEQYKAAKPFYGFATSPLVANGVLVVQVGGDNMATVGFDPATGELKWSAGSDSVGYQSPAPITLEGRSMVLAAGSTRLFALDAATGEILANHEHGGGGFIGAESVTPVAAGDGLFFMGHKEDASGMFRLSGDGDTVVAEQIWEDRSIRNSYTVPVFHEGHLYGFSSRFLTCVDAATGEMVWRSRAPGDGFVTLVDGHLVILTKKGSLHVARATPKGYEELSGTELFDGLAWSAPSIANGHIVVRSLDELALVDIDRDTNGAHVEALPAATAQRSRFSSFLAEVGSADDKNGMVDRFMESIERFPLVEPGGQVHFLYRGPANDLAIAGDMIGTRQERPMTRVPGTDLSYYSTFLEADARLSYFFLRDFEAITDPLNARKTVTMVVTKEMEPAFSESELIDVSWLAMPEWKPASHLAEGPLPGRFESHRVTSEHLEGEHEIEVYLPAGYDEGDQRYPLAIVHGGRAGRDRGKIPEAIERLGDRIEPVILLFVKTFSPLGGHVPYAAMVADDLIPFIDATYRTIPSRQARAHIGGGFSGYAALYCAFNRPEDAAKVGTHSAAMLDFMYFQLEPLIASAKEQPFETYLDWGKYDMRNPHESWDMVEINQRLVAKLLENGYTPSGGQSNDGPGWMVWQNRVADLLAALFPADATKATR